MEKEKGNSKESAAHLHVKNNVIFKHKSKPKDYKLENMATTKCLQKFQTGTANTCCIPDQCEANTSSSNLVTPVLRVNGKAWFEEQENIGQTCHNLEFATNNKETFSVQGKLSVTEDNSVPEVLTSEIDYFYSSDSDSSEELITEFLVPDSNVRPVQTVDNINFSSNVSELSCESSVKTWTFDRPVVDLREDCSPDPRIVLLQFLQDNVWMVHNITEQQILLRQRQAEIKAILTGKPAPPIEELITLDNDFTPEQQEAFERLAMKFDSTSSDRRRNVLLFVKDHPWILEAEIKHYKNCVSGKTFEYDNPSLKPDLGVLMASVFGRLDINSCKQ